MLSQCDRYGETVTIGGIMANASAVGDGKMSPRKFVSTVWMITQSG